MNSIHENDRHFVIIHGHFYQPPRENPWLGFIERQDSAAPYRHWTERITEECYRSNAFSPLLARGGRIAALVNNFEHLSFNVGPTLLEWLEPNAPDVYRQIIRGDLIGAGRRGGHGNAMAQAYNHAILPLCSRKDKRTQILWGLSDFQRRFGRRSRGLWLPETAVDLETAELLIECGVEYAVLAPSQLEATRPLDGSGGWEEIPEPGSVVHRRACRVFGRDRGTGHLDVFFFHPDLSREISFDHLLRDGRTFARRLERAFDESDPAAQAVVVATDGETFGHHEQFGNMCLSWVFSEPPEQRGFRLTNFGRFLELFPPQLEARLQPGPGGEGTAWSCAHGVGRWVRDCGCSTGAEAGWNQRWRAPLRTALNGLRDRADTVLQREGAPTDGPAATDPGEGPRSRALRQLQYYSQLMFTSCGWFFNDISGLEPLQNMLYARRVAELLAGDFGEQAEGELLRTLGQAVSNIPGKGTGARIYRREVLPRTLGAGDLAAAAALLSFCGVERPLGEHGEQHWDTALVEQLSRGSLALAAGWSRLQNRRFPAPRAFLHLVLRTDEGECRAWAEEVAEDKAESALHDLLQSLARSSEEEILHGHPWNFHREQLLPPAFREILEERLRRRQEESRARRMLELHGTGRDLYQRAVRNRDTGAALALTRLFEERVEEALERGDPKAFRPARGMLRTARALDLPLDTTAGAAAFERALGRQLERPDLFSSPKPLQEALKLARLGGRMGLEPAGSRTLQIRFWEALEASLHGDGSAPAAPHGALDLAELLGFHRRSLEDLFNGRTEG